VPSSNPETDSLSLVAESCLQHTIPRFINTPIELREELALDAVVAVFKKENAITLRKVAKSMSDIGAQAGSAVDELWKRLTRPPLSPKAV
jgi:hypothetical protein